MKLADNLLDSYRKQFAYYRHLGQATIDQLSDEELHRDDEAGSNSVAVIVKHLVGNMRSRWTDFLTTDGEKPWRARDEEFVDDFDDRPALQAAWNSGWEVLEDVLATLKPEELTSIIYIRNEGHTVAEAINRQLAHYSYHVGQIVLLGKQLRGSEWKSLSIPRGDSERYNRKMFGEERGRRHFTDDWLPERKS
jgi:uncharacterized damage-inducible protein DinB